MQEEIEQSTVLAQNTGQEEDVLDNTVLQSLFQQKDDCDSDELPNLGV